jgi:hypothetical protein
MSLRATPESCRNTGWRPEPPLRLRPNRERRVPLVLPLKQPRRPRSKRRVGGPAWRRALTHTRRGSVVVSVVLVVVVVIVVAERLPVGGGVERRMVSPVHQLAAVGAHREDLIVVGTLPSAVRQALRALATCGCALGRTPTTERGEWPGCRWHPPERAERVGSPGPSRAAAGRGLSGRCTGKL